MRITLEISDDVLRVLEAKGKAEERSRAAEIRLALASVANQWAENHQTDVETYCASRKRKRRK